VRDPGGKFTKGNSGNPNGRPAKADKLRQLLEGKADKVARKVIDAALDGDLQAARLVMERCIAPHRAVMPTCTFDLDETKPLTEQGRAVLAAIARGDIPPDTGKSLIDALTALARVTELDEIVRRLNQLEEQKDES